MPPPPPTQEEQVSIAFFVPFLVFPDPKVERRRRNGCPLMFDMFLFSFAFRRFFAQ